MNWLREFFFFMMAVLVILSFITLGDMLIDWLYGLLKKKHAPSVGADDPEKSFLPLVLDRAANDRSGSEVAPASQKGRP